MSIFKNEITALFRILKIIYSFPFFLLRKASIYQVIIQNIHANQVFLHEKLFFGYLKSKLNMIHFLKKTLTPLLIIFTLTCTQILKAQNQDCATAILVCGNSSFSNNSSGPGNDDFNPPGNNSGCLAGDEHQSSWYQFTIATGGTLTFMINPNVSSDDYDFAVFGPDVTCDNLGSPLRCSFSGATGNTGLTMTATDLSEGAGGDKFVRFLDVLPGETYYLLVDNWSSSNNGFSLTWGGTATLVDIEAGFTILNQNCGEVFFQNSSITCFTGITYEWDFGDGSPISTDLNPIHNYTSSGTYTITLTATASSSSHTFQQTIDIYNPVMSIDNLASQYCSEDESFTLLGTPPTGTFYINSAEDDILVPENLGVGTHVVAYSINHPDCNKTIVETVEILPQPNPEILDIENQYCINDDIVININTAPAFDLSTGILEVDDIATTQFNPSTLSIGDHTIFYEYTDPQGCIGSVEKTFTIFDLPNASIDLDDEYCNNDSNTPLLNGQYFVNGMATTEFSPSSLSPGTHIVTYIYTEPSTSCSVTIEKQITILPSIPEQNIEYEICSFSGDILKLEGDSDAKTYYWFSIERPDFILSETNMLEVEKSGTYHIKMTNDVGCETISVFEVKESCDPKFYIPTAFTPNNDGTNDIFQVFGQDFNKFEIQIFNRWGEVVFYTKDKQETWDGTYRGKDMPSGIYICVIKYRELPNGETQELKSELHLIR